MLGVVPAFIVSQWLAVRWGLPTRQWFNGLVMIGVLFVAGVRRGRLISYRRELAIALAVVAGVVLSAGTSGAPITVMLRGSIPYIGFILLIVGSLAFSPPLHDLRQGATIAVGSGALMGIVSVAELIGGKPVYRLFGQAIDYPDWWNRGRATGLVANPGRLGQVGALAIALAPLTNRVLWVVLAGAAVGASGSRLAVLSALAVGLTWLLRRRTDSRLLVIGALAAVGAFLVVQLAVPAARHDLAARNDAISSQIGDGEVVTDVRVANLKSTFAVWTDYPILGAGPGRFGSTTAWRTHSELHEQYGLPDVRSPEFEAQLRAAGDLRPIDVGIAQLDVGWLQVLAELGTIGLLGIAALLASVLVRSFRTRSVVPIALVAVLAIVSLGSPGIVDLSLVGVVAIWVGSMSGAQIDN